MLLIVSAILVLIVGATLYFLPFQTSTFFAWTIAPPLTASAMGAAYLGSFLNQFVAAQQSTFRRARVAYPAVLVFTILAAVVTTVHIDRFHFWSPLQSARFAAWVWITVYVVFPIVAIAFLIRWRKALAETVAPEQPMSATLMLNLAATGLLLLVVGLPLVISPATVLDLWPWRLTPLTARMTGVWSLGIGVVLVHGALIRDLRAVVPLASGITTFAVLLLLALWIHAGDVRWGGVSIWVLLAVTLNLLASGVVILMSQRRGA
jgi:hypothetical protein